MADEPFTLSVERRIEAAPDVVWDTMIRDLESWFCPSPWRAEARELDWRPGGRAFIVMHGPAGEAMDNDGVVLDFEPGRRFVFTDAFRAGWHPATAFMVGVFEIEPDVEATLYRASARHWTRDAMEQHSAMGFEAGWGAAADQLKALAEKKAAQAAK